MTNNNTMHDAHSDPVEVALWNADPSVPQSEKFEVLPWNTSHLRCKCGHKWDDHRGLGCEKCNCLQ